MFPKPLYATFICGLICGLHLWAQIYTLGGTIWPLLGWSFDKNTFGKDNKENNVTDKIEQLWDMMDDAKICMVTTMDNGVMRSRPMVAYIDKDAQTIAFLTDRTSAKIEELHQDKDIALSFVNTDDMEFVSLSGKGHVSTDRGLIKDMWGPYADVFFGGDADTADVAVISVKPEQAEYWDSEDGKLKLAYEMTKAYFTDEGPDIGDNAKLILA